MSIIIDTLKERLKNNKIEKRGQLIHELREISQEIIIEALSETDFFERASFHGGTSLRLVHRIGRYSEDLDFALNKYNYNFLWRPYLEKIQEHAEQYGLSMEISDKSRNTGAVKKAYIKDSSLEKLLDVTKTRSSTPEKTIIKLEIDAIPPLYAENEVKTLDFPKKHSINIQNLPSLFAGKCHALLCREYEKGRDWFDLKWFVDNKIEPNYKYLSSMINQQGHWGNQNINVDKTWLCDNLANKAERLNYDTINNDIKRFSKAGIAFNKCSALNIINAIKSPDYCQPQQSQSKSRSI